MLRVKVAAIVRRKSVKGLRWVGWTAALALAACETTQQPVLYPNAHLKSAGDAGAQRDIDQCMQLADDSGVSKSNNQVARRGTEGAAVGAAAGGVGTLIRGGSVGGGAAAGGANGGGGGGGPRAPLKEPEPTFPHFLAPSPRRPRHHLIGGPI